MQFPHAVHSANGTCITSNIEPQLSTMVKEMAVLRAKSIKVKSRRLNLVFFGMSEEEMWAQSQEHVIKRCSDMLGLNVRESGVDHFSLSVRT